jgi:hypothetical protein
MPIAKDLALRKLYSSSAPMTTSRYLRHSPLFFLLEKLCLHAPMRPLPGNMRAHPSIPQSSSRPFLRAAKERGV